MAFSIGDKVIYSSLGVCNVAEVDARMEALNKDELYYILVPINPRLGKAYVPHSKEDSIKPVISKSEALAVIDRFLKEGVDEYRDSNSRLVEDHFKKLIKTNDCFNNLVVIKSMKVRIQEQKDKGVSPSSTYMRLLDDAKKRAYGELSIALDIPVDDVPSFIEEYSK